jgi:phospholipase/carboxylesterase
MVDRRQFLHVGGTIVGAVLTSGCSSSLEVTVPEVHLTARPGTPTAAPVLGSSRLGLGSGRDGAVYVPTAYTGDRAWPLVVALHGAGGSGDSWASYPERAEQNGFVLLAPDSRGGTWDIAWAGDYSLDPPFIDRALKAVFDRCRIDPAHVVMAGFSDGASYALSLGVSNGDLFTHLIAYSPGFLSPGGPAIGKPKVYVSHGTRDPILPVIRTREIIVPTLRGLQYEVTFHEFDGGHEVPSQISAEAIGWALG